MSIFDKIASEQMTNNTVENKTIENVSRRNFIKVSGVATTGLVLGIAIPSKAMAFELTETEAAFNPNAFIHLQENGDLLLYCGRCEMGQGISTALPAAVADEMEADWSRVTVEQADGDEDKYGPQGTGGSASIRVMYEPMREAGAAAKLMLIAAAAKFLLQSVKQEITMFIIKVPEKNYLTVNWLASRQVSQFQKSLN
jgi:isoquinoline 1-oxidoreductase beta subunit